MAQRLKLIECQRPAGSYSILRSAVVQPASQGPSLPMLPDKPAALGPSHLSQPGRRQAIPAIGTQNHRSVLQLQGL